MKFSILASYLTAIFYLIAGVTFFLMPSNEQVSKAEFGKFLEIILNNRFPMILQMWMFALGSMFAIAVIIIVSDYIKENNEILVRWTCTLGTIGYAVIMVMSFSSQVYVPQLATAFSKVDPSIQSAIEAINVGFNDWMGFSLVGVWFVIIHILAVRRKKFSLSFSILGIVTGFAYFLAGIGLMLEIDWMTSIAAGLGGIILGPIWFCLIGIYLHRKKIIL